MKIMRTSILLLGALWLVTSHIPINKKCVEFLTSDANISNQTNSFNEICALPKYKPHNELLFVLTTCNHLQYSIQALETLRRSSDSFDLIIIDDYSVDGTTDYLIKKGYPVIVKSSAQGLTHSWNIGYRLGILLQYKYIIFANNDILIPSGAVDALRSDLAAEALVVPLTTLKGAGHNPSQDLATVYSLSKSYLQWYINAPHHFQRIQNALSRKHHNTSVIASRHGDSFRFNGFLFAVNVQMIAAAAYDASNLFDPNNINVEQENTLMRSMEKLNLIPKISTHSFIYHFKSVTVKTAAKMNRANHAENRNNLTLFHNENQTILHYPALYKSYTELYPHSFIPHTYPVPVVPSVVGVVSDNATTLTNHQAKMMSHALRQLSIAVVYLDRDINWYDLRDIDILLNLHPSYDVTKIEHAKPTLLLVAWLVNNFSKWMSLPWLGNYDLLLASSMYQMKHIGHQVTQARCSVRCPSIYVSISQHCDVQDTVPKNDLLKKPLDFVFIGPRHISKLITATNLHNYNCEMIIPQDTLPALSSHSIMRLAHSCSLLVVYAETSYWGELDAIMLEVVSTGAIVITNDATFRQSYYHSTILFHNSTDMIRKVQNILVNKEHLPAILENKYDVNMNNYRRRGIELRNHLQELVQLVPKKETRPAPGVCIGLPTSSDNIANVNATLRNLYARSAAPFYSYIVNTQREPSDKFRAAINMLLKEYNRESVRLQWLKDEHENSFDRKKRRTPSNLLNASDAGGSIKKLFLTLDAMDMLIEHFISLTSECSWIVLLEPETVMLPDWVEMISTQVAHTTKDVIRYKMTNDTQCSIVGHLCARRILYENYREAVLRDNVFSANIGNRLCDFVKDFGAE